jgi:hypothetical protein
MAIQTMSAKWRVEQVDDMLTLRVELWNGHSIVITAFADDAMPPLVALRGGDAEHDLDETSFARLRAWLDTAQGRRR